MFRNLPMFRASLALLASFSLTACGGGLGDLFANPQTVQMQSVASESGYGYTATGNVYKSTTLTVRVGDNNADSTSHGFFRFSTALIPPGANITEARLVVGQEMHVGTPYPSIGPNVLVDQVNLAAGLDSTDMTAPIVIQGLGALSNNALLEKKEIDVESAVEHAINNGWAYVDFRLRFQVSTDNDGSSDYVRFNNEDDDGGSGIRPALIVTYVD